MNASKQFKLYQGNTWNGYTSQQHLLSIVGGNDLAMAETVEQLLDNTDGMNLMSRLYEYGVERIPADKNQFGWRVENDSPENYELVGAYEDAAMTSLISSAATTLQRPGANQSDVFLVFQGRPFEITEIVGSERFKKFQFLVSQEPVALSNGHTMYQCQLSGTKSAEEFCPVDEFRANTRWFHVGGATAEERSERGFGIGFKSHGALKNIMSEFRMEYEISGKMLKQTVPPMVFQIPNVKSNLWISQIEFAFMRKIRIATASVLMDGKSNVWTDGTIQNSDNNGHAVKRGAGFNDLYSSSNLRQWSGKPNADLMVRYIMDVVIGKTKLRTADVICGEWGFNAIADAFAVRYGAGVTFNSKPWNTDGTGRAFNWGMDNELSVKNGQIKSVVEVLGIKLNFIIDESKDSRDRAVNYHPLGGPVSSYEYDIIGLGGKDAKSNLKIMRREGEAPIWRTIEGMRSPLNQGKAGSFAMPTSVSTSTDASSIHYQELGIGAKVKDPTAIVRYYPIESRI